ncbi:MAG TPA: phosphotransferase [Roseiflexaceae bacterium]|nr:phosphotransferase [Roseiflexaceae bacterium]
MAELLTLDRAQLERFAQQTLGPDAVLVDWQLAPIRYADVGAGSRALYRVGATVRTGAKVRPWSLILKISRLGGPNSDTPSEGSYWRREALLYRSGLLGQLSGGLTAPACYAVEERPDGALWLWLEDVAEPPDAPAWTVERYGLAARHVGVLGAFAGAALPDLPWLNRGWSRALTQLEYAALVAPMRERPAEFVPILRLWEERETLLERLERAPQCLCHHDLWRQNMFDRRPDAQTVLIDWEQSGTGALGEDAGNLLAVCLLNLDIPAAQAPALRDAISEGYQAGLRAAGWRGDGGAVQNALLTAAALRGVFLMAGWALAIARDASGRFAAQTEQQWGRPVAEVLAQWQAAGAFLLAGVKR